MFLLEINSQTELSEWLPKNWGDRVMSLEDGESQELQRNRRVNYLSDPCHLARRAG